MSIYSFTLGPGAETRFLIIKKDQIWLRHDAQLWPGAGSSGSSREPGLMTRHVNCAERYGSDDLAWEGIGSDIKPPSELPMESAFNGNPSVHQPSP